MQNPIRINSKRWCKKNERDVQNICNQASNTAEWIHSACTLTASHAICS